MAQDDSKYTDPELRAEIKEDIHASDKGGNPGQWSARKAQLTAAEYKKAMQERGEEPYTTDKSEKSDNQKHLSEWTEEEWQTSDGSGNAKQEDGTERRYLPKKAWESMKEEEKRETEEAKAKGSKEGHQYVPNAQAAKKARKEAQEENEPDERERTNGTKHKRDEEGGDGREDEDQDSKTTKKAKGENGEEIKTKSGADEGEEKVDKEKDHGQPGSNERLPEEGQTVCWKVGKNWTEGTVVEVLREEKDVDGIHAKASEEEPRIVLKSAKSGKKAVHKADAVYF